MDLSALNMTMNFCSLVILITLIFSQSMRHAGDRANRLFSTVMIFMAVCIGCDLGVLLCRMNAIATVFNRMFPVVLSLCAAIVYPLLNRYILMATGSLSALHRAEKAFMIICGLSLCGFILFAIAPFTGLIPFLRSILHIRTTYAFFTKTAVMVQQTVLIFCMVTGKDAYGQYRKVILFSLFLIVAAILDILHPGSSFTYAFTVLELLDIYLNFQLEADRRMEATRLGILNSRIELILGRIRPDFVLSILEQIENLCLYDAEKAQDMIAQLSDYLRGNIERIDTRQLIQFEDEIEHIESYIRLCRMLDEKITVTYDLIDKGFMIPIRTVYPVVEQFVLGGFIEKRSHTDIMIRSEREGNNIRVEVSGPARTSHHELDVAGELYKTICFRMDQIEGASFCLYADLEKQLHAVMRFPLKAKEKAHD